MNEKYGKVLAIDDNEDILFALKLLLKNYVEVIRTETNPDIIPDILSKEQFDVILLDMNFTKDAISGQEGFNWLEKILSIDQDAVVVFITAYGDAEKAVKAIKSGATDFILKPWQNEKLIATVSSAIRLRQSKNQTSDLKKKQVEKQKQEAKAAAEAAAAAKAAAGTTTSAPGATTSAPTSSGTRLPISRARSWPARA